MIDDIDNTTTVGELVIKLIKKANITKENLSEKTIMFYFNNTEINQLEPLNILTENVDTLSSIGINRFSSVEYKLVKAPAPKMSP